MNSTASIPLHEYVHTDVVVVNCYGVRPTGVTNQCRLEAICKQCLGIDKGIHDLFSSKLEHAFLELFAGHKLTHDLESIALRNLSPQYSSTFLMAW